MQRMAKPARRGTAAAVALAMSATFIAAATGSAGAATGEWDATQVLVQLPSVDGVDDHAYVLAGGAASSFVVWTDDNANESRARRWDGAQWGLPTAFPGGLVSERGIAISDSGDRAVVAWTGWDGSETRARAATWLGNAWSAPVPIGPADSEVGVAAMSGDGSTALVTVWDESTQSFEAVAWDGQDWSDAGTPPADLWALELSDDGTTATGLGQDGPTPVLSRWNGASWSDPISPPTAPGDYSGEVALHLSDDGSQAFVLSVAGTDADPGTTGLRIWSVSGTSWTAVSAPTPADSSVMPPSTAASDGSALSLAWADESGHRVATRSGSAWTTTTVPNSAGSEGALSASANGRRLVLAWTAADGSIWSAARSGGVWEPRELVSEAPAEPHRTVVGTSRDGSTSIAAWLGGEDCDFQCVTAAVRTPVALALASGPAVAGTARVGSVLQCTATYAGAVAVSYRWRRDGATIGGATGARYTAVAADRGHRLVCESSGSNGLAALPYAGSAATAKVALGPDLRVVKAPKIKGKAQVGRKLKVKHGSWSPAATSYRYQWLRDGKKIKGERAKRLSVTAALSGHKVSVKVVAKRAGYGSGTATTRRVTVR